MAEPPGCPARPESEAGLIEVAHKRKTWVFYRPVPEAVEALAFALGGAREPKLVLATAEATRAR